MYVRELDLLVTVMLLQDTPASLSLENSAKITDGSKIGPVVRNHISSKMALQHIEPRTIRCPWLTDELLNSSPPTPPTSPSQETVVRTVHPASTRCESMSEEAQGNLSRGSTETENPNKNDNGEIFCVICQNRYRSSGTVWWMKVSETLTILLINYLWSRERKWYRVSTAFPVTSRRTGIPISV